MSAASAKVAKNGKAEGLKLRIRVSAYESRLLDNAVGQIVDTALRHDADLRGPVPLPSVIKRYTVNRSTFIYKDSREQFEIRLHRRLIDILNPSSDLIEALSNMNLPSGIDVNIRMV